jgi:inhibitor of KinA sporulation pathway (predicted exonuclease)
MQPKHIIVYDLEFTAWPGSNTRKWSESWELREVIQLAAVKVTIGQQGATIVSTFNELVKPSINSTLSDYIIELTGINQTTIDEMGVDFRSALLQFYHFCQDGEIACYAWGNDEQVLRENCTINKHPMPKFAAGFVNLQSIALSRKLAGANQASGDVAEHLGVTLQGHKHNALFDVRSLACGLDIWLKSGELSVKQLLNK